MAAETYRLKNDRTDRIFPPNTTLVGGIRIRPNELVLVDLAVAEQDNAFDQSKYDLVAVPIETPIQPFI
jgi:hypothetical protein